MNEYEINEETMALIPISKDRTLVKEYERDFIVDDSITNILDNSCQYYGSTYEGRYTSAKKMLDDCSYKLPIIVEESNHLIFFPTKSVTLEDCCWINYNFIQSYDKVGRHTRIKFKNDQELEMGLSVLSLKNQMTRSALLELTSNKRRNSFYKNINN